MDVVLDSNIILSDPRMYGNRMQSLFRYLLRTQSSLVIPIIVWDEVLARYAVRIQNEHSKLINILATLHGISFSMQLPSVPPLDLQQQVGYLEGRLLHPELIQISEDFEKPSPRMWHPVQCVRTGNYSAISTQELSRRANNRVKPANEAGEQFRDVILWLMSINYAKEKSREVALISKDGHFFNGNNTLHPDLKAETVQEQVTIHAFRSIEDLFKTIAPSKPLDQPILEFLQTEESKADIGAAFDEAIVSYLNIGWRSRSEVTPLGDSVTEFKRGVTYSLATDSQYAELECEGTGTFAVGPYVFTKAPPFNPRDYTLTDTQVRAAFVVSGWIREKRVVDLSAGDIRIRSVKQLGQHNG
jgi:PIN domain